MASAFFSKRRNEVVDGCKSAAAQGGAQPEVLDTNAKAELVRKRGGLFSVPGKMGSVSSAWGSHEKKPTKLLLNVNIQNSLGPVHVVMSPENTVGDLIKAVVEMYLKEKRRPLLPCSDPRCFELHYSQFSLEVLKPEEKLKNLESRNFFLCPKPSDSINLSWSGQAKVTALGGQVSISIHKVNGFLTLIYRCPLLKSIYVNMHANIIC